MFKFLRAYSTQEDNKELQDINNSIKIEESTPKKRGRKKLPKIVLLLRKHQREFKERWKYPEREAFRNLDDNFILRVSRENTIISSNKDFDKNYSKKLSFDWESYLLEDKYGSNNSIDYNDMNPFYPNFINHIKQIDPLLPYFPQRDKKS